MAETLIIHRCKSTTQPREWQTTMTPSVFGSIDRLDPVGTAVGEAL